MRKCLLILLIVVLTFTTAPLFAQSNPPDQPLYCDLAAASRNLAEQFTGLAAAVENDQAPSASLETLEALQTQLTMLRAECTNQVYTGTTDTVLGPIILEDALYSIQLITDGYFIAAMVPINDECLSREGTYLFNITEGEARNFASAILSSNYCEMMLVIRNVTEPWRLAFEPLNRD